MVTWCDVRVGNLLWKNFLLGSVQNNQFDGDEPLFAPRKGKLKMNIGDLVDLLIGDLANEYAHMHFYIQASTNIKYAELEVGDFSPSRPRAK